MSENRLSLDIAEFGDGISVICPGLLGPVPMLPQPLPDVPCLDRLLARAKPVADGSLDPLHACLHAFGIAIEPDRDLPTGPIALLGEMPDADLDGFWMHADPVHLRPDRDRLLVFAGTGVEPNRAEADTLVDLFNQHFAADGLRLVAPTPQRWYLRVERPLDLCTTPLYRVFGTSMTSHLPEGPDASDWMRFSNEVQMLFYSSSVNRQRESQGRPMINGIWTWGGGRRPSVPQHPPDLALGDHPVLIGLARLAGIMHRTLDTPWDVSTPSWRRALLLVDSPWLALIERDLAGWVRALSDLDETMQVPHGWLKSRAVAQISLDPCLGTRFGVSPSSLRLFWRRKGFSHRLLVGQPD